MAVLAVLVVSSLLSHTASKSLTYSQYMKDVTSQNVDTANIDNSSGVISGKLKDGTALHGQRPGPGHLR